MESVTELYRNDNVYTLHPQTPSLRGYLKLLLARGFTREDIIRELSLLDGRDFLERFKNEDKRINKRITAM